MKMRVGEQLPSLRLLTIAGTLIVIGLLTGCAAVTTGSTFGSGVGEKYFARPPYTAGVLPARDAAILHLPIRYQRGAMQPASFEPADGDGTPVAALLAEMNAFLDTLQLTRPGASDGANSGTPPDVSFGCERTPGDECAAADERTPHRLAVGRPSPGWTAWARGVAEDAGADYLLAITLEIANYMPRQRNLRGDKEVLLGRDHAQSVRWLTALDRPVQVLQITGALLDRDGRAVRITAQGLTAHTTSIVAAGFGLQALISEGDVEHVRTARRDDLPGSPLLWQVALRNVVAELTGRDPAGGDRGK